MSFPATMTFLAALKHAETGLHIRRKAWSHIPADNSFHCDLIVHTDGRLMENGRNHRNIFNLPSLTPEDFRAKDWIIAPKLERGRASE